MKCMPTVFVSGYSQAPKGTKLSERGQIIGVMLEIDRSNHTIVDSECTFITGLAQKYYKSLVINLNFLDDFDDLLETIEYNLLIPSVHALTVALKIAHQRYLDAVIKP